LRHATRPNGVIDWEVYELGLNGDRLFGELSTDSDSDNDSSDGSDSDCILLYATSLSIHGKEICQFTPPPSKRKRETLFLVRNGIVFKRSC
jgi:hypothetical protein